ncbi:hypothetical protein LIER_30580 [Lithospermum erythrorhizon]|uniref:Uncharacterized protein n=1 Tax=Lithospermum erythrorhizon TaxID=34254 RepID=A0AAV3RN56_LITER
MRLAARSLAIGDESMVKVRLGCRAKLKCLDDVRKLLSIDNFNAMLEEYELVKFLYELEFFNIQVPTLLWLMTKGELETRNSATGMKTLVFGIGEAALDKDSVSFHKLPYGYVTPEAPELLKDYYVNAVNWVDKSATYVVGEDEEDNMPDYLSLTSAFQNLDRKVEEGFRCLDERIDERMDKIEARVVDLEKKISDRRKMEFNDPLNDGPPLIYELHGQKLVAKVPEHHSTMESLHDAMYKGDDVSDQPPITEGGILVTVRYQRLKYPSQICLSPFTTSHVYKKGKKRGGDGVLKNPKPVDEMRLKCHYLLLSILQWSFHATP